MTKLPKTQRNKYNEMLPPQYWKIIEGVRNIPVPIILFTINDMADNELIFAIMICLM